VKGGTKKGVNRFSKPPKGEIRKETRPFSTRLWPNLVGIVVRRNRKTGILPGEGGSGEMKGLERGNTKDAEGVVKKGSARWGRKREIWGRGANAQAGPKDGNTIGEGNSGKLVTMQGGKGVTSGGEGEKTGPSLGQKTQRGQRKEGGQKGYLSLA